MEAIADLLYELPKNYGLVFDVAHYVVCLQAERADLGPNFETLTRSKPLVSLYHYFCNCAVVCKLM